MTSLLFLLAGAALGADQPVDSRVSAVTVFADRARVTREVSVEVPSGRTDLVFDGLPIQLLSDSLAAEGEGTAGATLTGIDIRPQRGTEDRDERVAALVAERQGIQDRIGAEQDVIQRVQGEMAFLKALSPKAPDKLDDATFLADDAPDQLAALARQVGGDLRTLYEEQRAAERRVRDMAKDVARIDRELQELAQVGNEDSLRVAVGLDARRAGRVTVRLDYVTTGASWTPRYDARYDLKSGDIRLDMSGEVQQRTGEDWQGIDLVLSTAKPQQGTAPPRLSPFYLQEGYSVGRDYGGGAVALGGAPGAPMTSTGAVVSDRATAFEFEATRAEDVPADGTLRRVFLVGLDLEGDTVHQVVARRLEAAWLTARVVNSAEFAILPGPVSSYLGTAYVGEGQITLTAPGDELDLSFGVDDRVGVERTRLEDVSEGTRPLGNRERRRWGFRTTVENRTGDDIQVQVHDQVHCRLG